MASGVAKPDGLLVVPPDRELTFLHALPIERLWGVGVVTADKLHRLGISTVGQVAGVSEGVLVSILGRASGRHLHALAHNRDPRPVQARRRRGSIGSQCALGRRRRSPEDVDAVLIGLVDRVLPQAELLDGVRAYAKELATMVSPRSLRVMKKQVYEALFQTLGEATDVANVEMMKSFGSADFREGVAHFLEKRPPAFTGK